MTQSQLQTWRTLAVILFLVSIGLGVLAGTQHREVVDLRELLDTACTEPAELTAPAVAAICRRLTP